MQWISSQFTSSTGKSSRNLQMKHCIVESLVITVYSYYNISVNCHVLLHLMFLSSLVENTSLLSRKHIATKLPIIITARPDGSSVAQIPARHPEGERSAPVADQARAPESDMESRTRGELALPHFTGKSHPEDEREVLSQPDLVSLLMILHNGQDTTSFYQPTPRQATGYRAADEGTVTEFQATRACWMGGKTWEMFTPLSAGGKGGAGGGHLYWGPCLRWSYSSGFASQHLLPSWQHGTMQSMPRIF